MWKTQEQKRQDLDLTIVVIRMIDLYSGERRRVDRMLERSLVGEANDGVSLQGDWRVERVAGLLPPMVGVHKRIRGEHGETRIGPLLSVSFRLEGREGYVALIYRPPFSMLVDELWPEANGSWIGRSTLCGRKFGRFRMIRSGYHGDVDSEG